MLNQQVIDNQKQQRVQVGGFLCRFGYRCPSNCWYLFYPLNLIQRTAHYKMSEKAKEELPSLSGWEFIVVLAVFHKQNLWKESKNEGNDWKKENANERGREREDSYGMEPTLLSSFSILRPFACSGIQPLMCPVFLSTPCKQRRRSTMHTRFKCQQRKKKRTKTFTLIYIWNSVQALIHSTH